MTNHLMDRHGSPTTLSVWMQLDQSIEYFVPNPKTRESLHWEKLYAENSSKYLVLSATACRYLLPHLQGEIKWFLMNYIWLASKLVVPQHVVPRLAEV